MSFLFFFSLAVGFYMAWNIGASDVANTMGTAVGAGTLSLRKAVILASILEFLGAFLCGQEVIHTIHESIIDFSNIESEAIIIAIGMNSSLLAAGIWLQVASYFGWPVSTTHTIVGAITGFGFILKGAEGIKWKALLAISCSWILSPALGALFSYVLFSFLQSYIFHTKEPIEQAKKWVPKIFALFVICIFFILNFRYQMTTTSIVWGSGLIAILSYFACYFFIKRQKKPFINGNYQDKKLYEQILYYIENSLESLLLAKELSSEEHWTNSLQIRIEALRRLGKKFAKKTCQTPTDNETVENIFSYIQIASTSFMAFAHGANDVANAAGPLFISINILEPITHRSLSIKWILTWSAIGIVIGLVTWGWRVIHTVGKKITELTPSRGFSAECGCALTVMIASQIKMPISTTHTLIGSLLGIGIARGSGNLNLKTLKEIFISWIVTIPAGTILCWIIFNIIKLILC